MSDRLTEFLLQFDGPLGVSVAVASFNVFADHSRGQINCRHPEARRMAVDAFGRGLLKAYGSDQPVPDSDDVFHLDLELTAAGREACGLPPIVKPVAVEEKPKPVKAKKPQKKPVPCFDFGDDD